VISDEFLEFIPMSVFKIEDRGSDVGVVNGREMSKRRCRSLGLGGYTIHMWETKTFVASPFAFLNKTLFDVLCDFKQAAN